MVLKGVVKQGILYEYLMLIEKSGSPVSQAENTFIVRDGGVVGGERDRIDGQIKSVDWEKNFF